MTRRSTQGDSGGRSGGSRPPKRRRSPIDVDADRRSFLFVAVALASGGILGCDPSGTRDRRLPGSAGVLDPIPPNVEVDQPIEPPPVKRIVQRPLPPTSEPRVRVRVATVRPPDRVVRIDGDGRAVRMRSADDPGQPKTVQLPATIQSTLEGWVVIEAAGTPRAATFAFPPRPLEVMPQQGSKGVRTTATGTTPWPWGLRLVARTDEALGAVDLVVHVAMEEYLPGVLAKELYNTWSLETHLAQAVAARSFAICEVAQNSERHFDLVAGEASQAWTGPTTHRASLEAARRTRGMSLVWDARVVPAYYSSTCGGRPASAIDVISSNVVNDIPPLTAVAGSERTCCRAAPNWRWKMTMPTPDTARRIAAWARTERPAMAKIDGIASIEVFSVNAVGRPLTHRILDGKNQAFEIPSERLRWAFNADVPGVAAPRGRVKSADFEAVVTRSSIALAGRGFGHGVGLCQFGAEALSKQGRTWRDILKLYYPGADVVQSYT